MFNFLSPGGGSLPSKLQVVAVNIESNTNCATSYPKEVITNNMVCAAAPKKDSCQVSRFMCWGKSRTLKSHCRNNLQTVGKKQK